MRVAGGGTIAPDPDRAVDVLVHSPYWLDPDVLVKIVAQLPTARLAIEGEEWEGPPPEVYPGRVVTPAPPGEASTKTTTSRCSRRRRARPRDPARRTTSSTDTPRSARSGPYGQDGAVEVLVHVADPDEPSVDGQSWAAEPFVTYEVRWSCPEPDERERRTPSPSYLPPANGCVP